MDFTKELLASGYFTEGFLAKGQALFQEGEKNTHLYILLSGECSVNKIIGKQETKEISIISKGDIIGEGALTGKYEKTIDIIAIGKVEYISINVEKDFQDFSRSHPGLQQKLLIDIIDFTNQRLLQINSELISNYHISEAISNISQINSHALSEILLLFCDVLESSIIIYLEKNPVVDTYYKIVYHNEQKTSLKESIIELTEDHMSNTDIKVLGLHDNYLSHCIILGGKTEGIIVVSRKNGVYDQKSKRILKNITTSFSGIIHQKKILDEQKNISYSKLNSH